MELSLKDIKESLKEEVKFPFGIGNKVLIRTVTHIQTGEITELVGNFVVLKDAAWIADTGRFNECLGKGTFSEVEPMTCKCIVNITAIIDAFEWQHALPRGVK